MIIRLPLFAAAFLFPVRHTGYSAAQGGAEKTVQRGAEFLFGYVDSAFLPPSHRVDQSSGVEGGGHLTVGSFYFPAAAAVFVVDQLGEVTLYRRSRREESILLSITFSTNFLCSEIKL